MKGGWWYRFAIQAPSPGVDRAGELNVERLTFTNLQSLVMIPSFSV
jgi:hypothetical protein